MEDDFGAPELSAAAMLKELADSNNDDVMDNWDDEPEVDSSSASQEPKEKQVFSQTSAKKASGKKKMVAAEKLARLGSGEAPAALRSYEERKADEMRAREMELNDIKAAFGSLEVDSWDGDQEEAGGNRTADGEDMFGGSADAEDDNGTLQLDKFVPHSESDFERLAQYLLDRCEPFKELPGYMTFVGLLVRGLLTDCPLEDLDAVATTVNALANEERKKTASAGKKKKPTKKTTTPSSVTSQVYSDMVVDDYDNFM